jgi:hypothetical protein
VSVITAAAGGFDRAAGEQQLEVRQREEAALD